MIPLWTILISPTCESASNDNKLALPYLWYKSDPNLVGAFQSYAERPIIFAKILLNWYRVSSTDWPELLLFNPLLKVGFQLFASHAALSNLLNLLIKEYQSLWFSALWLGHIWSLNFHMLIARNGNFYHRALVVISRDGRQLHFYQKKTLSICDMSVMVSKGCCQGLLRPWKVFLLYYKYILFMFQGRKRL